MAGTRYNPETFEVLEDTQIEIVVPRLRPRRRFTMSLIGPRLHRDRTVMTGFLITDRSGRRDRAQWHRTGVEFFRGYTRMNALHENARDMFLTLDIPRDAEHRAIEAWYTERDPVADEPTVSLFAARTELRPGRANLFRDHLSASFGPGGSEDLFTLARTGGDDHIVVQQNGRSVMEFVNESHAIHLHRYVGVAVRGWRLDRIMIAVAGLVLRSIYLHGTGFGALDTASEDEEHGAVSQDPDVLAGRQRERSPRGGVGRTRH